MFWEIGRSIINFLLAAITVLVVRGFGWLTFTNSPDVIKNDELNILVIAGIIGIVISLVGEFVGFLYRLIKRMTFIFGCFVSLVYFFISGYIKLSIAALILTGWFTYTNQLLPVIIMSLLIGSIRLPHHEEVEDERKKH
jgi:hypothetical protein